jgi:uncharacterized LabA/DUF88 family protein/DNA-binding CsgD family transcriptional regulator
MSNNGTTVTEADLDRVSPAQRRVLEMIVKGLSPQDIAEKLELSIGTIRAHTAGIYRAFDVHSRAELMGAITPVKPAAKAPEPTPAPAPPQPPPRQIYTPTQSAYTPAQSSGYSSHSSTYSPAQPASGMVSDGGLQSRPADVRPVSLPHGSRPFVPRPLQNRNVAHERVAIFIDGWNFAKATYEGLGIRVDFKRLLATLTGGRTLLRAFYYIGEWTPENYAMMHDLRRVRLGLDVSEPPDANEAERKRAQQQGFIRMLNRNGYQVVKKPVKVFADGNTKADLDIELAIDMLTLADRCERIVLVSGDSDFVPVVRAVGMRGVRVEVVGSQQPFAYDSTPDRPRAFPARASDELLDAADEFTELSELVSAIELQEPRRPRTFAPAGPVSNGG